MSAQGIEVNDKGDQGSEGGAIGSAVREFAAGNLVEREQKHDVRGDAEAEECVIDRHGGEAPEREEGGESCEGPEGQLKVRRY